MAGMGRDSRVAMMRRKSHSSDVYIYTVAGKGLTSKDVELPLPSLNHCLNAYEYFRHENGRKYIRKIPRSRIHQLAFDMQSYAILQVGLTLDLVRQSIDRLKRIFKRQRRDCEDNW